MCTGKCAKCIGGALFPLALCSIVANILLYFPNGQIIEIDEITDFVWFFPGIAGGGILILLPAFMMFWAGGDGCCGNRCGMMLSVLLSAGGFIGAGYCTVISGYALAQGPLCETGNGKFEYPFRNDILTEHYLLNQTSWELCKKPENIVLWNLVLFSALLGLGAIDLLLCLIQVINGLFGCLCGTCIRHRQDNII
ncbi:uncharacterized protein LOC100002960 homolog [Callorhinchus milii]|uniref:Transmembrane 4 L six family member 4 n=1 Tax=Callorhinchus milii TaxID=7868 RepID=K4G0I3_CALMI|nr:uncharacterized protein LOC100002960 homolog [Callorhinchus milii]AFK11316.1 transmembrane 4 L six family member 4 [Callorhinchus milii]|eukprot:gi/632937602/ref/XP_007900318.1/ PREDICTED: transmembrane 4 L6 family member 1-like [Callorhinchus milii]